MIPFQKPYLLLYSIVLVSAVLVVLVTIIQFSKVSSQIVHWFLNFILFFTKNERENYGNLGNVDLKNLLNPNFIIFIVCYDVVHSMVSEFWINCKSHQQDHWISGVSKYQRPAVNLKNIKQKYPNSNKTHIWTLRQRIRPTGLFRGFQYI